MSYGFGARRLRSAGSLDLAAQQDTDPAKCVRPPKELLGFQEKEVLMKKVVSTVAGGILGLLISYLFAPSMLGMRPTLYEYYIEYPEFKSTILICVIVGLAAGFAVGLLIDRKANN